MILPPYLQTGSKIKIICPSGYLPLDKSIQAKIILESWGYEVELGNTTKTEYHYFSAPDALRLHELQDALNDKSINAILMGRGGYGMSRIIDDLNFETFIKHPKWILGFSDITVLHCHLNTNYGISTLHAPMCSAFGNDDVPMEHMQCYKCVLRGTKIDYTFDCNNTYNQIGYTEGEIIGGNLCMLDHLSGSISQINTDNKILFIEDIGEHLYKIDRMLYNLKRSGNLSNIKGLICGNFSDIEDTTRPFGKNLYEIILEHVASLNIPVAFDIPIGHEKVNFPLILGAYYKFEVTENSTIIQQF
jgi:muramoyltetrapeptide carboxypeptidase